jgi:hypothetical protein
MFFSELYPYYLISFLLFSSKATQEATEVLKGPQLFRSDDTEIKTLEEKIEHLRNHVTNVDFDDSNLMLIARESEEYNIHEVRQGILYLNNNLEDALINLDYFPEDIRKYSIPIWNILSKINAIYFEKIDPPIPPSELTTVATSSATAGATTSPPTPPLAVELATAATSSASATAGSPTPISPISPTVATSSATAGATTSPPTPPLVVELTTAATSSASETAGSPTLTLTVPTEDTSSISPISPQHPPISPISPTVASPISPQHPPISPISPTVATSLATAGATTQPLSPPTPPLAVELATAATSSASATAGSPTPSLTIPTEDTSISPISPQHPPISPISPTAATSSATGGASTQPPSPPRKRKTPFSSDQTKKRANSSTSKVKFFSV